MRIKQTKPNQTVVDLPTRQEVQIPIFPIPVRSKESFLMYALCFHAVETGIYADMPEILPHLQAMKNGLEMAVQPIASKSPTRRPGGAMLDR